LVVKSCRQCGSNSNEFQKDRSKKDGLRNECKVCSKKKDDSRRKKDPEGSRRKGRENYRKHRLSRLKTVKKYYETVGKDKERGRVKDRAERALETLGGKCAECGRTDSLSIDHINDDGKNERRDGSKDAMIKKILKQADVTRYQVLCHNHNQKKQILKLRRERKERTPTGPMKHCGTCEKDKDMSLFHGDMSDVTGKYYECSECTAMRRDEVKARALSALGGECKKCGERDVDMLSVDHIIPAGKEREGHGQTIYRMILRSPRTDWLQVLCFNCNQGKGARQEIMAAMGEGINIGRRQSEKKSPEGVRTIEYDLESLSVLREDATKAAEFLDRHHYDMYGRHAKRCYSARSGDEIVAVAKMCSATRQGTPMSLGMRTDEVLELDRMACSPSRRKKNLMSWFLSRVVKMVRKDFPKVKILVSFADTEMGHDGATYRASNWEESGRTGRSYHYMGPDGSVVKKKTFFDRIKRAGLKEGRTESEVAREIGMSKVVTAPKIRFVLRID
jgi:hypothetical protein